MYEQYHACTNCINQRVSLHTASGASHEGVIVGVDYQNVYLDTSLSGATAAISSKKANVRGKAKAKVIVNANEKAQTSGLGFGLGLGSPAILTLALFDLLAIALIV